MKKIYLILFLNLYYFTLFSQDGNKNNIPFLQKEIANCYYRQDYLKGIQKSIQLIKYCEKIGNRKEIASAYETLGIIYSDLGDFKKSINYYHKALLLIDSTKQSKIYYSILLNIGTTLMDASNYHDAKIYLSKSLTYFQKTKPLSYSHLIASYTNLAITYQNLHQLNKAYSSNLKAINIAEKHHLLDQFCGPLINMGDILLEQKKYHEAYQSYKDAQFYFDKLKDKRGYYQAIIGISNVLIQTSKQEKAIPLLLEAKTYFTKINDFKDITICYKMLSQTYAQTKNYKLAYYNKKSELIFQTQLTNQENFQTISNMQLQYKIFQSNQSLNAKSKLIQKEKKISTLLYIILALLIICIVIIVQLFRKKQTVLKDKTVAIEKSAVNQKSDFDQKLSSKDKELEIFALHIVQKNDFIEQIKEELKSLKKINSEEVKNKINPILLKLNSSVKKDKELDLFLKRVEEVNANFYQLLLSKFPDLTSKERKLCALIKLNLTSKDISTLTNVSIGAVTMARYRLRSKINIEKDENLAAFFQKLK
ncbi:MAG: tetratricopeptide repeat protein [Flavobacteriia bacterium]|nr:tetratricopeptide repeat protein [Flavobacteriia bacterium]